jgi:hypothetical protein
VLRYAQEELPPPLEQRHQSRSRRPRGGAAQESHDFTDQRLRAITLECCAVATSELRVAAEPQATATAPPTPCARPSCRCPAGSVPSRSLALNIDTPHGEHSSKLFLAHHLLGEMPETRDDVVTALHLSLKPVFVPCTFLAGPNLAALPISK